MQLIDFDDKIYFQRSIERRSKNSSLFFPLPIFQNPFLKGIIPGNESRGLLVPRKKRKKFLSVISLIRDGKRGIFNVNAIQRESKGRDWLIKKARPCPRWDEKEGGCMTKKLLVFHRRENISFSVRRKPWPRATGWGDGQMKIPLFPAARFLAQGLQQTRSSASFRSNGENVL